MGEVAVIEVILLLAFINKRVWLCYKKADNSLIDKIFEFGINQVDPSLSDVHCGVQVEGLGAVDEEVDRNNEAFKILVETKMSGMNC